MQNQNGGIVSFLLGVTLLITLLAVFIVLILFFYQKKQLAFEQNLEKIRLDNEKTLLQSQLEIQEQTFQTIAREIHDNIGLTLTLAKLQLNNLNSNLPAISSTIDMLSESIYDLSNLSRSMNSDSIIKNGFLRTMEKELEVLRRLNTLSVRMEIIGDPVYIQSEKELIIFRIAQEALNNILRHAKATSIFIDITYCKEYLSLKISDNGIGFQCDNDCVQNSGLINMKNRTKLLRGKISLKSIVNKGTEITVQIPY